MASSTVSPASPATGARFPYAWRALNHRNFRLFVAGQGTSLIGTWMTRVATSWLVYRLTGSAWMLGVVGFVGQVPTFLLAPVAGVWVDRMDRRRLLVWTQVGLALQSLIMGALILARSITVTEILILSVAQGLINAFDMPARQSFVVQMVEDRKDLGNAIALNSSMVNVARLVGPALAGLIIGAYGEGPCFMVDGISYLAVIVSLLMMHITVPAQARHTGSVAVQLREGWTYVSGFLPIKAILLLFATTSLLGMPYMVLMPVFAHDVLHGGPHTLGYLMTASGVGGLISALVLAARKSVRGLTTVIPVAASLVGAGLILFGLSRNFWVSLLLMFLTGYGLLQGLAASNTVIQTLVPEDKRGRVMSYYTMAFIGMAPFGALLAGGWRRRSAPRTRSC